MYLFMFMPWWECDTIIGKRLFKWFRNYFRVTWSKLYVLFFTIVFFFLLSFLFEAFYILPGNTKIWFFSIQYFMLNIWHVKSVECNFLFFESLVFCLIFRMQEIFLGNILSMFFPAKFVAIDLLFDIGISFRGNADLTGHLFTFLSSLAN